MPSTRDTAVGDPRQIERYWEEDVLPVLGAYTRVPCLSPAFDPGWEAAGHLARAADLLGEWARSRSVPGLGVDVVRTPGATPLLLAELPATPGTDGCVLVYGHLDKQPPQGAWRPGLGPFEPVRQGDLLFGRGTADDGYSLFAAVAALELMSAGRSTGPGAAHPRVVVLIEGSEESGSPDLADHLAALGDRIGRPDLVICLDSGCLTYDRLWVTTSLRGNVVAEVRVDVLEEGIHSGLAGGIVPSSFRVLRTLLSRVEDERTGEILLPELRAEVPERHGRSLEDAAALLPDRPDDLPLVPGLELSAATNADRLLARAFSPALSVIGIDGIPALRDAGNVLRPFTTAMISMRIPPTVDVTVAADALERALVTDPPYGARVAVDLKTPASGWVAPDPEPWVIEALDRSSEASFGVGHASYGEGGTIPFLATLAERFPTAQFVATGVLGPHSNAHGPNEFLHLPMARAVTLSVMQLLDAAGGQMAMGKMAAPGTVER